MIRAIIEKWGNGSAVRIPDFFMEKDAKEALQVAQDIMVKFMELRRVSPDNFSDIFPQVYQVVLETITRPNTAGKVDSGKTGIKEH